MLLPQQLRSSCSLLLANDLLQELDIVAFVYEMAFCVWTLQSSVLHAMQSGDQETALQTYDRALQLDRNNVDAYVARGAAFANQRDFSRAVADFETALGAN